MGAIVCSLPLALSGTMKFSCQLRHILGSLAQGPLGLVSEMLGVFSNRDSSYTFVGKSKEVIACLGSLLDSHGQYSERRLLIFSFGVYVKRSLALGGNIISPDEKGLSNYRWIFIH